MSLTNKTIANTYKDLLQVDNSNNGVATTLKTVKSGNGTDSALKISDDQVQIQPNNDNFTGTLAVKNLSGGEILNCATNTGQVTILGQYANTQVKTFGLIAGSAQPSSANTWTMLASGIGAIWNLVPITMGTGGTPDTSYDISTATTSQNLVHAIWYVPFNIVIDACHCWFGQNAASGDVVKFSVMSYDISTANDATGGDLSNGTEVCVSPSTITGAGHEQAYYQSLTVSSSSVSSGKVIIAYVSQDGTNSDQTIDMQLVYHMDQR
jgi:hypothetical protein